MKYLNPFFYIFLIVAITISIFEIWFSYTVSSCLETMEYWERKVKK